MMTRPVHFMCVLESHDCGQSVLGHRPFLWDAAVLHDRPAAAPEPVILYANDTGVFCTAVKSWRDVSHAMAFSCALPVNHAFVVAHSKPMLERPLNWGAREAGGSTGHLSAIALDFIELLNSPAVLDLQDRRSWSLDRLQSTFGSLDGCTGAVEAGGGIWNAHQVGRSLHRMAKLYVTGS